MSNKFYDATKSPDHQEVQYRVTLVLWTISRGTFGHFSSSLSRRESLTKWNFFGAVNLQSTLAVLALSYSQCIGEGISLLSRQACGRTKFSFCQLNKDFVFKCFWGGN